MRLIQIFVPADTRDGVLEVLRDADVDYVLTREDGAGDGATLVQFPIPTAAVEDVLEALRDAGLPDDNYTVVANAAAAASPNLSELEERYVAGNESGDEVSAVEIRAKAQGMQPGPVTYYAMTLLSALVATVGLLLDSPAIVVGSMVIAPQIGSAMTTAVGVALGDRRMFVSGVRSQALSIGLVVLGAVTFGWAIRTAQFVPPALTVSTLEQISSRTSPGLLTIVVALCAGGAGGFGLATELPVSLVGVAVAAAIVPAAAAVGVGVAWLYPAVTFGALMLLVVNVVCINLAATAVLWYLGYRPGRGRPDGADTRVTDALSIRVVATATVVVVLLLTIPGGIIVSHVQFESHVNDGVQDVLDDPSYGALELRATHVQFGMPTELGATRPRSVMVEIGRPSNREYPGLADRLERAAESRTNAPVTVEVTFRDQTRSSSGGSQSRVVRGGVQSSTSGVASRSPVL